MADATGMHSYNTTVWWAADNANNPAGASPDGEGYERFAEVVSLSGVGRSNTVVEVTHLSSDDFAKEKIPGFEDGGQVTFRLNYSTTILAALDELRPQAGRVAGSPGAIGTGSWGRLRFVMQLPDGAQWWFRGFVQGAPFTVPEDDRITVECTIEISGKPVFTAAA